MIRSSNLFSSARRTFLRTPARNGMNAFAHSESKLTFSTKAVPQTSHEQCPLSRARKLSSDAASTLGMNIEDSILEKSNGTTTLQVVPKLPVVGSFFSIIPGIGGQLSKYYNVPALNNDNMYEFYSSMNKRYGDFYKIEIPGFGEVHILTDPNEMIKVLRQEGAYPLGGISNIVPFINWARKRGLKLVQGDDNGFFGQGETWRSVRTFMQSDLLSPQAARGYVPLVVEAAQIASKGAKHYSDNLNTYLNYCAFDMFQTIMFGELTKVADPNTNTDPQNLVFVENSVKSLGLMIKQLFDKTELFKAKMGIATSMNQEFEAAMDIVNEIANEKVLAFKERWERGQLTEAEKSSYIAHAFERQKTDGAITAGEMSEILMFALNAGVDTTSTFICWAMVHLSLNPSVQEKLYEELKTNVEENGGILTSDMLSRKKSPYLHAVLRESHRLTPVHPTVMTKSNSANTIEIHGVNFPKGSLFSFDSYSVGIDPAVVQNPENFDPQRWTDEAVASRKGTRAEVLDHQFYKDPFSQGARRCPGSRVAVNETLVLLSQLVLDWKFEPERAISSLKDIKYEQQTLIVPVIPKMLFTARV